MDLFEYQGKQFFAQYGIPVSDGAATDNVDEAVAIADRIGYPVVIKAQVQVGGRGKAGGVKLAANADEAREHATNILGLDIKGHIVHQVLINPAADVWCCAGTELSASAVSPTKKKGMPIPCNMCGSASVQ